jgi:hypothetical protein
LILWTCLVGLDQKLWEIKFYSVWFRLTGRVRQIEGMDEIPTNLKIVTFLGLLASLYRREFTPLVFAYMYYYLVTHWNNMTQQQALQQAPTMEEIQAELAAEQQRAIVAKMGADPRQMQQRRQILPTVKQKQMNARGFVKGFQSSQKEDEDMMNAGRPGPRERHIAKHQKFNAY